MSAPCQSPTTWVAEEWQAEAGRCWDVDGFGVVPGFIAEMTSAKDREAPDESPPDKKFWRRLEGERAGAYAAPSLHTEEDTMVYYYSGKHARDTPDVCAKDYQMAMQLFGESSLASKATVLDLSCGDGLMARRFTQSGDFERVFAVDISRKQLEALRRAAEEERTTPEDGLFLARGDAAALPFSDGQVDFVWWGLGLHMVKDPAAAMRSIFRVMRPGGRLLATTLSEAFIPEELARITTEAGFTDRKSVV